MSVTSSLVFRAIRNGLPNNPEAQERIVGAILTALLLGDVSAKWLASCKRFLALTITLLDHSVSWFPMSRVRKHVDKNTAPQFRGLASQNTCDIRLGHGTRLLMETSRLPLFFSA